jgi:arylsulfatase A-like enzyme
MGLDARRAGSKPNVLFVFSDQHRATDLGCYGNDRVHTPNLDAFAAQGARAKTAVSNTPVCGPYRASLMTGMYTHRCGYPTNYVPFRPPGPCVAEVFKEHGYDTGYVGKWHLNFPTGDPEDNRSDGSAGYVPPGARHGFDDYWAAANGGHQYHHWTYYRDDPTPVHIDAYQPETQVDLALEFIRDRQTRGVPWCLFLSWGPPHTPFDPPPGYAEPYADSPLPPNVPAGRATEYAARELPNYYGLIQTLDEAFGRLMAELDAMGATDDTVCVYTSDHGEMLGSHGYRGNKRWPHDASLRVPFLARYPGHIKPGATLERPIGTPDLFPTLVELAGIAPPSGLDGSSAATALLTGDESDRDEYAYCTMPYAYVPWPGWRALRSARHIYARTQGGPWLLYDLERDPWEMHNLVGDVAASDLIAKLDARLVARMAETGDHWGFRVDAGDCDLWQPGTSKMRSNDLGVPWPGSDALAAAERADN